MTGPTMQSMTGDDIGPGAQLVRRWWDEVWGQGRLDAIAELTTDPFIRHAEGGTAVRTHAELAEDMARYRRFLQGCTPVFQSQLEHGDRVYSRIRTTGVNMETEEPMVVHWLQEHRVAAGRLAETWTLYSPSADWKDGPTPPTYPNTVVG